MRAKQQKSDTPIAKTRAVLAYERMIKCLILAISHTVLQIVPREHDFGFHGTTGEIWQAKKTRLYQIAPLGLVLRASSPCRNGMFGGGRIHIMNMTCMKIMDRRLISVAPAEDLGM
jgi:hypothetical protein